jgi:hypothetical protein
LTAIAHVQFVEDFIKNAGVLCIPGRITFRVHWQEHVGSEARFFSLLSPQLTLQQNLLDSSELFHDEVAGAKMDYQGDDRRKDGRRDVEQSDS